MAFVISGRNLPSVRTYEQAVKAYENAHVHDRFGPCWRGLGTKRDTSKLIQRVGDVIKFRYHQTDLVEWTPTQLRIRCYDSQSSVIFISCFTPYEINAGTKHGEMYVFQGDLAYMPPAGPVIFDLADKKWVVDPSSVMSFQTYVLDKKRAAEIRKVIKPFRDYRDGLLRLRGGRNDAIYVSESRVANELRVVLERGSIDEAVQKDLLMHQCAYDDDILLKNAYLAGGAVKKETNEFGAVRKPNPYAGRAGLRFLSNL